MSDRERVEAIAADLPYVADRLTGTAKTRACRALVNDGVFFHLAAARYHVGVGRDPTRPGGAELVADDRSIRVRDALDDLLEERADTVIQDAITDVDVHGHQVTLSYAARLTCPACETDDVEAFYLGTVDEHTTAWVCGECGATLHQTRDGDTTLATSGGEA